MKKLLSVIIALTMALSVATISTTVAFATVASPETTTAVAPSKTGQVNGVNSNDIVYTTDPTDANKITFTYNGDGTVTGWEFPGMTEGSNYQIVSQSGNTVTILLINGYNGQVIANAITEEDTEDVDDEDSEDTTVKKENGSTSPDTGATGIAGVAFAGVGIAILAAMKKKDAE